MCYIQELAAFLGVFDGQAPFRRQTSDAEDFLTWVARSCKLETDMRNG
jgi:hypothetical protein